MIKKNPGKKCTVDDFLLRCEENFSNKFTFPHLNSEYKSLSSIITVICPVHGMFKKHAGNFLKYKHGCSLCANDSVANLYTKSLDDFLSDAKKIHGDKYSYENVVYTGCFKKIEITCHEHGNFMQSPSDHLNGNGCKECGKRVSKEKILLKKDISNKKRKQTNKNRYGVEFPMHNVSSFEKQQKHKSKTLILPSGREVKVQGYEDKTILYLLSIGYTEDDLLLTNRPTIKYGEKVYHPDLVIPKENRIIETKSSYTYKKDYLKLSKIADTLKMNNIKFEVWIW